MNNHIQQLVRPRRRALNLTQKALAEMVGASVASISTLENGKREQTALAVRCIVAMGGKIRVEWATPEQTQPLTL